MRDIIFDIEVFPKWWCIVYSIMPDTKKYIITSETENKIQKIKDLIKENCLIGFNIKGYDLRILNAIINDFEVTGVYDLSKAIIANQEHVFNNYSYWFKFIFCDLYDDWRYGTLKEFESNIGMNVKECQISFNKEELSDIDKEEIIEYCQHDVEATIKLYQYRQEYIDSKKVLSELCNIDLATALRSTNAKLSAIILKAKMFNRPMDYNFSIPEKVKWYVEKSLPKNIISLFDTISEDQKECDLFNNKVVFGVGGIHSTYSDNILCRSDNDYALMNIDATSYYPNLIMKFNYMSRNCITPKLYEDIYNLRVKLKNEMNDEYYLNGKTEKYFKLKKEQNALKLILNTTYGAMKNKYNALFDEYRASCVCYLGQLLLASLANNLHNLGDVKIVQTNTDGLLIKYRRDSLDKIKNIVQEWVFITDISMEYKEISMFFQKDVNNYIEIDIDNKIKLKGKWANQADEDNDLVANLNAPITHKAIVEYYINKTPLIETIMSSDNLLDFCFTTKTGYTYDKTYHYIKDRPILVKKVNRVVATKDKDYGTLKKYKKENGKERYDKISELPDHCYLMNGDLDYYSDLDRMWYANFASDKIKELREI